MQNYLYFFTATILNWQKLLKPDKYKQIICDSLNYLVTKNRVVVFGFVVMPNHIHIIWQINEPDTLETVQRDFLKYTAQQIKFDLQKNHLNVLTYFKSNAKDRAYQFWERRPYSSKLYNREVVEEKLNYIHNNPMNKKWNLCNSPEQYPFSSASFYLTNNCTFDFITDYREWMLMKLVGENTNHRQIVNETNKNYNKRTDSASFCGLWSRTNKNN